MRLGFAVAALFVVAACSQSSSVQQSAPPQHARAADVRAAIQPAQTSHSPILEPRQREPNFITPSAELIFSEAAPSNVCQQSSGGYFLGANVQPLPRLQPVGGNLRMSPSALAPTAPLPPSVDFRSMMGPIRDQQQCGTCVSFAAMAVLEAEVGRFAPNRRDDLSEQQLVSCGGIYSSCQSGTTVPQATAFLARFGHVTEQAYPYSSGQGQIGSCGLNLGSLGTAPVRAREWRNYGISNATQLKDVLFRLQRPVIAVFAVWSDFYSVGNAVYTVSPSATQTGAHAVTVVGYSDADGAFIVRNSWGTGFGNRGYFRIAYSEVSAGSRSQFAVLGGGVTAIEGVVSSSLPTFSSCTESSASTAYCDVSVQEGYIADFVVRGVAEATSNGTGRGSMALNVTANGEPCNAQHGVVYGVDNRTKLEGDGFVCRGRVQGGTQVRIALDAPNHIADAVYTRGAVTLTPRPISNVPTEGVCVSLTNTTARCNLRTSPRARSATFTVVGDAYATSNGTNSGSMQLLMTTPRGTCNSDTSTHGVDNATRLTGPGYTCTLVVNGGESLIVNLVAPNNRSDGTYTRATVTFTESN